MASLVKPIPTDHTKIPKQTKTGGNITCNASSALVMEERGEHIARIIIYRPFVWCEGRYSVLDHIVSHQMSMTGYVFDMGGFDWLMEERTVRLWMLSRIQCTPSEEFGAVLVCICRVRSQSIAGSTALPVISAPNVITFIQSEPDPVMACHLAMQRYEIHGSCVCGREEGARMNITLVLPRMMM